MEMNHLKSICFAEPSRFELLVDGRKICGSAQVRTKNAFLQHGSLLLNFEPERAVQALCLQPAPDFPAKLGKSVTCVNEYSHAFSDLYGKREALMLLIDSFRNVLKIQFTEGNLTPGEQAEKSRLITEKYSTDHWNKEGKYEP